jgi:Cu(I)/Ag(I) efflux system membrane protein CusA/SilA
MLAKTIKFFLENKLVAWLLVLLFVGWGLATGPFDYDIAGLPRDPVAVDAIPDIGENQQIVFTQWMGRSPQDVEDQISYPLTTALLGIPGVKGVRSNSMFGFSSIYLIFEDELDFYWSRSRILEKLNSLPANLLPEGVQPTLGPDATALGQIFWYTLEGRDAEGNATGGWNPHELRSIQDFYVRYGLSAAKGVSEVASIGGYVREYQVDVNPEAMKVHGINLEQVMKAIRESNLDVGAQTIEINFAEYFVRGLGYVKKIEDIENSVVKEVGNVPILIRDVAHVNLGPATRRGVLDKSGTEAVGGVVVARYGSNPLEVIEAVKEKIGELTPGLPSRTLSDGTVSQVNIIPFYDRTDLIKETIGTLEEALSLEILITIIVVILMLLNLKASFLVSSALPIAVLMCFIGMRYLGVDANIVALSGIAIAIGTMVDMGIVLTESMLKRIEEAPPGENLLKTIYEATIEVASAILTAVATTVKLSASLYDGSCRRETLSATGLYQNLCFGGINYRDNCYCPATRTHHFFSQNKSPLYQICRQPDPHGAGDYTSDLIRPELEFIIDSCRHAGDPWSLGGRKRVWQSSLFQGNQGIGVWSYCDFPPGSFVDAFGRG